MLFLCAYLLSLVPCLAQPAGNSEVISSAWIEGNGLTAEYFNGSNFQQKVLTRIDKDINFSYLWESPAPGVQTENYSIRWTGRLFAPVSGNYKIIVRSDDGVRLWLNGLKLIDQWKLQKAAVYYNHIDLQGGEFYSLRIEYFNEPSHGTLQLMWESPEEKNSSLFGLTENIARKVIPTKYLFGDLPGEAGEQEQADIQKEAPALAVARKKKGTGPIEPVITEAEKRSPEPPTPPATEVVFENLKPGEVVTFKDVLFEQGKYILLEGSHIELDKLVRTMTKYPALKISIEGHTDNVGDPNLNLSLSLFRAKVVETYLAENGIDHSRIEVRGHGSSRPLADNKTEEGRAKNRRVEFVVR